MPRLAVALGHRESLGRAVREHLTPVLVVLPPAVLLLLHLLRARSEPTCLAPETPFRERVWALYSLTFLRAVAPRDATLAKIVALLLLAGAMCAFALVVWKRQFDLRRASILAVSFGWAATALIAPAWVGSGASVRERAALFAFVFLAVWLASMLQQLRKAVVAGISLLCIGIAVATIVVRAPILSRWSRDLSDIVALGSSVRPGSTVLALRMSAEGARVEPFVHATGLLPVHGVVDLQNYEAGTDYFPTSFRPNHSTFPALGEIGQLETAPPSFDVDRYERRTEGRVDYILVQSRADDPAAASYLDLYANQLRNFVLVRHGPAGFLYGRSPHGEGQTSIRRR